MNNYIGKVLPYDANELLSHLDDNSVEAIITDPPYDLDEETKKWYHRHFLRISRGVVIVFSPPKNQWILPADQHCFWVKPISTKNTSKSYSNFVEMIFIYRRHVWNCNRHWSQYTNVFNDLVDNASLHKHRKPPSLIERLVLNHTNAGDIILDPFAGSFVVADVAEKNNRLWICSDNGDDYA